MLRKGLLLCALCATTASVYAQRDVEITQLVDTVSQNTTRTIKRKVAIGRFTNETRYGKGIFYDKNNDPMGKQVLDMFSTKMTATGKFLMLERNDLNDILHEAQRNDENTHQPIGADYLLIGSLTEYGRKEEGKEGVFTTTRTQKVEAAVSIRLVEVSTGLVVYSDEGRGFAETTVKKNALGLGGTAEYDATLMDKALGSAIGQLVENITLKCTNKPWRTYILSHEEGTTITAGGASQGIKEGDTFGLFLQGKKVKNPQTGIMIELPGKQIGKAKVLMTGGDTPETEYAIVHLDTTENIDTNHLMNYYLQENK